MPKRFSDPEIIFIPSAYDDALWEDFEIDISGYPQFYVHDYQVNHEITKEIQSLEAKEADYLKLARETGLAGPHFWKIAQEYRIRREALAWVLDEGE